MFIGIFDHPSRSAFVRSTTDAGWESLAHNLCSYSSQRCSVGLWSGLGDSQLLPHQTCLSMSLLAFLKITHSRKVMLEQAGAIPKLLKLSKIIWYAEALRVLFTGTKELSPTPEKQPYTITPPPPTTLYSTMPSYNYCSLGYHQTQTGPADCKMEIWFVSPENMATVAVCFTPLHTVLYIGFGNLRLGSCCSPMEIYSRRLSTPCFCVNLKSTWSLDVCNDWFCRKLVTTVHYVRHNPLLCDFPCGCG